MLFEAITQQFNHERQNEVVLRAIADKMQSMALEGAAKWFCMQALDERGHSERIAGFILNTGHLVDYSPLEGVSYINEQIHSLSDAIEMAVNLESNTSAAIQSLYRLAVQESDIPAQQMLLWFVQEQVKEEAAVRRLWQKVFFCDGNAAAIMQIDALMGAEGAS